MSDEPLRLCIDCVYFREPKPGLDVAEFANCAYYSYVSPVDGRSLLFQRGHGFCNIERDATTLPDYCGPDGRFFVAKEAPSCAD